MGLMSSPKKKSSLPYFLASGRFLAGPINVSAEKDKDTGETVYRVTFRPQSEVSTDGGDDESNPKGLSLRHYLKNKPLETPDISHDFDMADESAEAIMVKLFGTPNVGGAWGEGEDGTPGLCKWNGRTGSDGRFGGAVEIQVRALPPRPRQGSGYWPANYQLIDIDEPGAAAKVAEEAAAKLAAKYRKPAKPASEATAPAPTDDKTAAAAEKAAEKARKSASKASKASESAE